MKWEAECDLLVAGTGAAGLTAALVGAIAGLSVIVCEKESLVGGTTATSGGVLWIPCSAQAKKRGINDRMEDARLYLRQELGARYRDDLVDAFLETGPEAIDFLEQHSEVRYELLDMPDYHDGPGSTVTGRALVASSFDGRRLGRAFVRVAPPLRRMMVFGGMTFARNEVPLLMRPFSSWHAFRTTASLVLRHLTDRVRYPRGTRLMMGNAMVARYLFSLRQRGVPVRTRSALTDLIIEDGKVTGAWLLRDGHRQAIKAQGGVILATGGVPHNIALREELAPDFPHAFSLASSGNTGDGVTAARNARGAVDTDVATLGIWSPASRIRERDGGASMLPYGYIDRGKPGAVLVNRAGKRFVNEANSYQDVVQAMYARRAQDELVAYIVVDCDFMRDFGLGMIPPLMPSLRPYLQAGYIERGETIEALAQKIDVEPTGLADTIASHSVSAESGRDAEFGKGETAFNRYNGDPGNQPNPCLRPIARAPFYALRVHPTTLGTSVGLATDRDACVLDANGTPIKGLWACGSDATSVMAGYCPAAGITLGPAVVFGYRAAMSAAKSLRDVCND